MRIRNILLASALALGGAGALTTVGADARPCTGDCHQPNPSPGPTTSPSPPPSTTTTLATDECPTHEFTCPRR